MDNLYLGGNFDPEKKYLAPPPNSPQTPSQPFAPRPHPPGRPPPLLGLSIKIVPPLPAPRTPLSPPLSRKEKKKIRNVHQVTSLARWRNCRKQRAEYCFESTVSEGRTHWVLRQTRWVLHLVAHDCGYPLSRFTCRATRVAADFLDFIAFCRCSTGVAPHPLKILVSHPPPLCQGGVAPKFGSEKVSRYTGVSQLQLRVSRYTVQLRFYKKLGAFALGNK